MIHHLKGIHVIKRANGAVYYYHRATKTRLLSDPTSAAFIAEVAAIEAKLAGAAKPSRTPGTWGALVEHWRSTAEWDNLAAVTKSDYLRVLDYLSKLDDDPLTRFTAEQVMKIRNKAYAAHKRRFANYVLAVISRCWGIGQACGKTPHPNPVSKEQKVRRPKNARVVNRPWTVPEVEAVLAAALDPIKVAVSLALWAGWREGDVCRMTAAAYNGKEIEGRAGKTGELVWMPAHTALRAVLDAELELRPRSKDEVLVLGVRGKAYTQDGFKANFFRLIRRLTAEGKVNPGLTFHGLRVTLATAIAEAGGDTRAIAAALGHATITMAQHYARLASRKVDASRAIALLEEQPKGDL